jgi:hypothetical protein
VAGSEDEQGFGDFMTIAGSRRGRRTALVWMLGLCVLAALGLGLGVGAGGSSKSRPTSKPTPAVSTPAVSTPPVSTTTATQSTSNIASPAAVSAFVALLAPDPNRTMSATYTVSMTANAPITQTVSVTPDDPITETVWTGHGMSAFSSRDGEGPFEVIVGAGGYTLCDQRGDDQRGYAWRCASSPSPNGFASWQVQAAPNLIAQALSAQLEMWQNFSEELRITEGHVDGLTVRCLESIQDPGMLIGPLKVCVTPQGIPVSFSGTDQDNGSQLTVGLVHLALEVPKGAFDPPATPADLVSCTDDGLNVSGSFNQGSFQQWILLVSFEDISDLPCSMSGFPEVIFADAEGNPIGKPAIPEGAAGPELILEPGSSAEIAVWEPIAEDLAGTGVTCSPVLASGLSVTPPGQSSAVFVTGTGSEWNTAMTTCSAIPPTVDPLLSEGSQ